MTFAYHSIDIIFVVKRKMSVQQSICHILFSVCPDRIGFDPNTVQWRVSTRIKQFSLWCHPTEYRTLTREKKGIVYRLINGVTLQWQWRLPSIFFWLFVLWPFIKLQQKKNDTEKSRNMLRLYFCGSIKVPHNIRLHINVLEFCFSF